MPFRERLINTLIISNSFIHDMSTGLWIGALIVMELTFSKAQTLQNPLITAFSQEVFRQLWSWSVLSFVVMLLTGGARAFTLKYYGWSGDIAHGRKSLLIIKHIILTIIVCIGLYLQINIYLVMNPS